MNNAQPSENSQSPHKKIFQLTPVEDDLTTIILRTRDKVIEETSLHPGARLMFCRILDLAVRSSVNVRPGVVTISQQKLGEMLGVSSRTIFNYKLALMRAGLVWFTSKPMPNCWPIDTYHIEAIDPKRGNHRQLTTEEGMWGNGKRRQALAEPPLGCREPGQLVLKAPALRGNVLPGRPRRAKSSKTPAISTASGNTLPLSAEAGFCGEPKRASAGSGSQLPRGAETDFHGEPKPASTGSGNPLRRGAETGFSHKKAKVQGSRDFEGGTEHPPPPKAADKTINEDAELENWRQSLVGMFPSRVEKLRDKLVAQRNGATAQNVRAFIGRKIRMLNELLEGPMPPAPEDAPPPAPKPSWNPTPEEILEGARYALSIGKPELLTKAQKAALANEEKKTGTTKSRRTLNDEGRVA